MKFGQTFEEWFNAHKTPRWVFAFLPHRTNDGRTIWLEYGWKFRDRWYEKEPTV